MYNIDNNFRHEQHRHQSPTTSRVQYSDKNRPVYYQKGENHNLNLSPIYTGPAPRHTGSAPSHAASAPVYVDSGQSYTDYTYPSYAASAPNQTNTFTGRSSNNTNSPQRQRPNHPIHHQIPFNPTIPQPSYMSPELRSRITKPQQHRPPPHQQYRPHAALKALQYSDNSKNPKVAKITMKKNEHRMGSSSKDEIDVARENLIDMAGLNDEHTGSNSRSPHRTSYRRSRSKSRKKSRRGHSHGSESPKRQSSPRRGNSIIEKQDKNKYRDRRRRSSKRKIHTRHHQDYRDNNDSYDYYNRDRDSKRDGYDDWGYGSWDDLKVPVECVETNNPCGVRVQYSSDNEYDSDNYTAQIRRKRGRRSIVIPTFDCSEDINLPTWVVAFGTAIACCLCLY